MDRKRRPFVGKGFAGWCWPWRRGGHYFRHVGPLRLRPIYQPSLCEPGYDITERTTGCCQDPDFCILVGTFVFVVARCPRAIVCDPCSAGLFITGSPDIHAKAVLVDWAR